MEFRTKLMFRWSLASAAAITLFWTGWYLINGSVPVVTEIKITPEIVYRLPFGISRWWDVLLGPFYSTVIVFLLSSHDFKNNSHFDAGLGVGLAAGLSAGFVAGLISGFVGIVASLSTSRAGFITSFATCLTASLVAALFYGLASCLVISFFTCIGASLGVGFVALLKYLWQYLWPINDTIENKPEQ